MAALVANVSSQLDAWQALYIITIILGVISTLSIVLFSFHLKSESAARWSHYTYLIVSCLTVLSTIVIIAKTKSLDAEKDRQTALRIASANERIADAEKQASEAKKTASGFQRDIADANREAAEANRTAEQERLARIKIEEKLAGWRLGPGAQARLRDRLERYPKSQYDLAVNPQEWKFMETMDAILKAAGWVRVQPKPDNILFTMLVDNKASVSYGSGIVIAVSKSMWPDFGPAALALVAGLRAEGIPARGEVVEHKLQPNVIQVVIGKR